LACNRGAGGVSLAITSGKGGVGKTNIAVNLAACLASWRRRVTLVDLDVGVADVDVLLNVQPRFNLSHVVTGERTIDEVAVDTPLNVRLVAGGSGVDALANVDAMGRQRLASDIQSLEKSSDFLIYDCGAGVSANVLTFAERADIVIVVSTPEPTALTDAYAMVKVLTQKKYHGLILFVVNMVQCRSEALAVYQRAAAVTERFLHFKLADGGYVLHDSHVESAVRAQSPFVVRFPRCPSSLCMTALAARLVRSCSSAPQPGGLLSRFAGLFA